jgi:hypothetical protein
MSLRASAMIVLLVAPLGAARAQTSDERAFAALRSSSIGSLTSLLTPAMLRRRLNGAQLGIRYGLRDEDGLRTQAIAASAILPAGDQSSVTLTGGVLNTNCNGCESALLLGVGGDMRIAEMGDVVQGGSLLSVGVSGDLGYAQLKPSSDYAITLGIGLPVVLSIASGARGMRFAPYFTPVFGVGETSTACPTVPIVAGSSMNCDKSGVGLVLGGGIGVWNPESGVAASIGINHVVHAGSKPVFGINVILGGR